jgi:Sec-independent protein translocase protein TatA
MHDFLDELIGPSATNWLIIGVAALVILGAITLLPALVRRLFGTGREPLL